MTATTGPSPPASSRPAGARLILRIDALVETLAAGCCLALAARSPRGGLWRLPGYPGSAAVLLAIAGSLLAAAALLWWLSGRPGRRVLIMVCAANAVTAAAIPGLAVALDAGSAIKVLLADVTLALAALALAQGLLARQRQRSAAPAA